MPESAIDWPETFAQARGADVGSVAGVPLFRSGRRLRGECPLCGASKGKRADGAFSVEPQLGVFKCWGCGEGGDVVDLERALRGGSLREAALRLVSAPVKAVSAPAARPASQRPTVESTDYPRRVARELLEGAVPQGGLGAVYLSRRGLDRERADRAFWTGGLRFNGRARWGWGERLGLPQWIHAPAMVGWVSSPGGGTTGGVHCTYLRPDGSGKAALDPAKRMWGPMKDAEGRPGGVWLSPVVGPGPLIVGEGIESTLSAMQLWSGDHGGAPCRGVATLSLNALQGGWLRDRFGRVDPDAPSADPESPAFVWPGQDQVIVAVDRDMSPITVKVRKPGGGTGERRIDAEDRARICAGLAAAAWRSAGANDVRVIAPAAGRDFNDELRARAAAGE